MTTSHTTQQRCPKCGEAFSADTLVCPHCRIILAPHSPRARTPGWVIGLLVVVIVALIVYIVYSINTVIIQHNY